MKAQKWGKMEQEKQRMGTGDNRIFLLLNRCVCFKEEIGQ